MCRAIAAGDAPSRHASVAGKTQLGQLRAPVARTEVAGQRPTAQLRVYQALSVRPQYPGAEPKLMLSPLAPEPFASKEVALVVAVQAAAQGAHRLQQQPSPQVQGQQPGGGCVAPTVRVLAERREAAGQQPDVEQDI